MASKYILSQPEDSFADFETEIEVQSEAGFNLTELEYVDKQWLGIFSDVANESVYITNTDAAKFNQQLENTAKLGHKVIDLELVDDTWIGLLSKEDSSAAFFAATNFDEFEKQVPVYQDKGDLFPYELSNIEYSAGNWLATLDKAYNSDVVYKFSDSLTGLETKIEAQEDAGFGISSFEYAEGKWVGVFRESDLDSTFFVGKNQQEFDAELEQRQKAGLELVDLEIVGDRWIGVFSEPTDDYDMDDLNQSITNNNIIRATINSVEIY